MDHHIELMTMAVLKDERKVLEKETRIEKLLEKVLSDKKTKKASTKRRSSSKKKSTKKSTKKKSAKKKSSKKKSSKKSTAKKKAHKKKVNTRKTSSKPTVNRKKSAKKKASKKKVSKKKASRKKASRARSTGYARTPGGILAPTSLSEPVPPAKIRSGISKAKEEIRRLIDDLEELTDGFEVSGIELAASFSAEGKFLGIGVGGATTITIRFKPSRD